MNAARIEVRHNVVRSSRLPRPFDGLTILQISDLHASPTMRLAYVQRVVDMTQALAPESCDGHHDGRPS